MRFRCRRATLLAMDHPTRLQRADLALEAWWGRRWFGTGRYAVLKSMLVGWLSVAAVIVIVWAFAGPPVPATSLVLSLLGYLLVTAASFALGMKVRQRRRT